MRIWPAIDLRGGNCVRLIQGDYRRETVYGSNPADMALRWESEGATGLHIVDLDGARDGRSINRDAISQIADEVNIELQIGGGIRSQETIEDYLSLGIKRLVIGTKSIKDQPWIQEMAQRYEHHLIIGIDARNGKVASDGWQQTSQISAIDHAVSMASLPIASLIYTDIARDGTLTGVNIAAMQEMQDSVNVPVIASGGVTSTEDIIHLSKVGIDGCIIGRALYEGKLTLPDAISASGALI